MQTLPVLDLVALTVRLHAELMRGTRSQMNDEVAASDMAGTQG
jgi:hypothetical protein